MSIHLSSGLPSNVSEELKALVLMTPYDGASDKVALASRDLFTKHLKNQSSVHDVFFSGTSTDPLESKITGASGFEFQGFATAYTSAAIGRVSSYNFGGMVDEQGCLDYMKGKMSSESWKKLGMLINYWILCTFANKSKSALYTAAILTFVIPWFVLSMVITNIATEFYWSANNTGIKRGLQRDKQPCVFALNETLA